MTVDAALGMKKLPPDSKCFSWIDRRSSPTAVSAGREKEHYCQSQTGRPPPEP